MELVDDNCVETTGGGGGTSGGGGSGGCPPYANPCTGTPTGGGSATEETPAEEPAGEVLGATTSNEGGETCSPLLYTYMRMGKDNDRDEVVTLQTFLNQEMGLEIPVTGFFGQATHNGVNAFQLKYANEVLNPWYPHGLAEGTPTGYVYKTTLRWINKVHCDSLDIPMPMLP